MIKWSHWNAICTAILWQCSRDLKKFFPQPFWIKPFASKVVLFTRNNFSVLWYCVLKTVDDAACFSLCCHLVLQILVLLAVPVLTLTEWAAVPAQWKKKPMIVSHSLDSSTAQVSGFPNLITKLSRSPAGSQNLNKPRCDRSPNPYVGSGKRGPPPAYLVRQQEVGRCSVTVEDPPPPGPTTQLQWTTADNCDGRLPRIQSKPEEDEISRSDVLLRFLFPVWRRCHKNM